LQELAGATGAVVRIGDMTQHAFRDTYESNKAAIFRRPRAALRPMIALFVGGSTPEHYRCLMSFGGGFLVFLFLLLSRPFYVLPDGLTALFPRH
jgi:hypothetical protein